MEAEVIAIAHSCCKLFPIMDGASIMGKALSLSVDNTTIQVLIHKDNAGALILDKTLQPQFLNSNKDIGKHGIKLLKISTAEQLGDLFTTQFENLRKKLMGW